MLNHSTDVLPPPAGIQRPVTSLMQCFGGGCFRYPGEPPCEHCGGKAVELPLEEPAAEADSTNVEEPDSDDVTVEETYSPSYLQTFQYPSVTNITPNII